MARNTNALFLIICGAIIVLSIFIIVNGQIHLIESPFKNTQEQLNSSDNEDIPEQPVFSEYIQNETNFIAIFNTSGKTSRYSCLYGPRISAVKKTAVITLDSKFVRCDIPNLDASDKFVQLVSINGNNKTFSEIKKLEYK